MPASLRAMNDQNHRQQAERLRALWKSGRDKYASFFSVLNEVRQEIGDEALPTWCFDELRIGISVIAEARRLLTAMDAEIVKADLAAAKRAEREQREAEAEARRAAREKAEQQRETEALARQKAREETTRQRELEKAEHEKRLADIALQTQQMKDAASGKPNMKKKEQKSRDQGKCTSREKADAQRRRTLNRIDHVDFSELVRRYKLAEEQCVKGNEEWIAGSLAKGAILLQMREKHPAHREFGDALIANGINLNADDRAALIGLAGLGQSAMREILESTDSRSYRLIWIHHNKPTLRVVEN